LNVQPVTLTGKIVRLAPLDLSYNPELTTAGQDENIWKYMRYGIIANEADMHHFVTSLLVLQERGTDLPFVVIHLESQIAVGMTRYMNIETANRALEIGGTWYSPQFQRTGVNTECKFLLLQHAFETLACVRVQIKTDLRNERSQRAIERLGAVREVVLRDHMILPDGTLRSSVYYSILAREWPQVKQHLLNLMKDPS
jgi:N-acetyltransferase